MTIHNPEDIEVAAAALRSMIIQTDGAYGNNWVDLLEEAIEQAYERGYDQGRDDERAVHFG
jgi:hypothetical protein